MTIQKVTAVYFSPTRGTAHYAEAIAAALAPAHDTVNLTVPFVRRTPHVFGPEDLVIIGAPVYAGRLPAVKGLWDSLEGHDTPAIFLVSYGNRAYDDALLELQDLCEAKGFRGVAASAWIAPHTFSAKIGAGRPDEADRAKIRAFAEKVRDFRAGRPSLLSGEAHAFPSGRERSLCPLRALRRGLSRAGHFTVCAGEDRRGEMH